MAQKYSFLVIKYPYAETAQDALATVREIAKEGVVKLRDAVAITKTDKGKIKIQQTKDDSIGKGFVKGGVIGILFAALFGPSAGSPWAQPPADCSRASTAGSRTASSRSLGRT